MTRFLATLPTTTPDPALPPADAASAINNAQIVLLGLLLIVLVIGGAMGLLLLRRIRRKAALAPRPQTAEDPSPWAIAGGRAEIDEDDGLDGVQIGDDDTDPNEDTWAGAPPA